MARISIGAVLDQFIQEKNLTAVQLADRMGKTRQTIYNDLKRTKMSDGLIEEYAKAFDIDKDAIYERWGAGEVPVQNKDASSYLMAQMAAIEEQFKKLHEQLSVKDRQIERLMDLLGKLSPATSTSKEISFSELLRAA